MSSYFVTRLSSIRTATVWCRCSTLQRDS